MLFSRILPPASARRRRTISYQGIGVPHPIASIEELEDRLLLTTWPASGTGWLDFTPWTQRAPYNDVVPNDPVSGERSLAGCVATAVGQIMQYWNYPSRLAFVDSTAEDSYTYASTSSTLVNIDNDAVPLDFSDFDALNASLQTIDYDLSDAEVADLSFAAGIKAEMQYTSQGSGAYFSDATFQELGFGSADYAVWDDGVKATVIENMKNGMPAALAIVGTDATSGYRVYHAVVAEGYRDDNGDEFLINLGSDLGKQWAALPDFTSSTVTWDQVSFAIFDILPDLAWSQEFGDARNTSRSPHAIPTSATQRWHQTTDSSHQFSGMVTGTGGRIYVANASNTPGGPHSLWVIDGTGTRIDDIALPASLTGSITNPAQSPDNRIVYIPTDDGKIFTVDVLSHTTSLFWEEEFGLQINSIKIDSSGNLFVVTLVGTNGSTVYSISPTGSENWHYSVAENNSGTIVHPRLAIDDVRNFVYVPFYDSTEKASHLLVLDRVEGNEVFDRLLTGDIAFSGFSTGVPSIASDGTVYVGSFTTVFALDPEQNFSSKWVFSDSDQSLMRMPPTIGSDGTVYLRYKTSSEEYLLAAVDPDDGSVRTSVDLELSDNDDVTSIVTGANGLVTITLNKSNGTNPDTWSVVTFNDTGTSLQEVWRTDFDDELSGGHLTIGPGNTLYVIQGGTSNLRRITALASGAVGDPRGGGQGFTDNQRPAAPSNPGLADGSTVTSNTADISWNASDPDDHALSYTVLLGRVDGEFGALQPVATGITSNSFTLLGLQPGSQYFWKIIDTDGQAINEGPLWGFDVPITADLVVDAGYDSDDGTADTFDVDISLNGSAATTLAVTINGTLYTSQTVASIDSLTINGSGDDDTVTINLDGGVLEDELDLALSFNGGGEGTDGDTLSLQNGTATDIDYAFTNSTDGTITFDSRSLSFTGVEPIKDSLGVTNRSFTFPATADTITLSDDGDAGNGQSLISHATDTTVTFSSPGTALVLALGDGDDTLTATPLDGGFGATLTINGDSGADTMDASLLETNVKLNGSADNDTLTAGNGNDTLSGGAGEDELFGGPGNDKVKGQGNQDTLSGGDGDDTIEGGSSYNTLDESSDVNFVVTNTLLTGPGTNTISDIDVVDLYGGPGNNLIDASSFTGRAFLNGGGGHDTLLGGAGHDVLRGGSGQDSLVGNDGDDRIYGQGGHNDNIDGGNGDDKLDGGNGRDILAGGNDDDRLTGGIGLYNDTLDGGPGNDELHEKKVGNATLTDSKLNSSNLGANNQLSNIEVGFLKGGSADETLDASDFPGDVTLIGMGGADTLKGGIGNDSLSGRSGNDSLLGGDGEDTLLGLSGDDTLNGGAADDFLDGGNNNDGLSGWTGSDLLVGGNGDDTLLGGDGSDTLQGLNGDDTLIGDDGRDDNDAYTDDDDELDGGDGNDTVRGGDGTDTLIANETIDESFTFLEDWVDRIN
jgi:Ca2+-binding RTX toxin-like protein